MLLWLEGMARTLIGAPPTRSCSTKHLPAGRSCMLAAITAMKTTRAQHAFITPGPHWRAGSRGCWLFSFPSAPDIRGRIIEPVATSSLLLLQGGDYSILLPQCQPHPWLSRVQTPLCIAAREKALASHPDWAFVRYSAGNSGGFPHQQSTLLQSASCSMHSVREHPDVIRSYLEKECALNYMLSPFPQSARSVLPPLHINHFGVIPKGYNTGKWQLITDLSYPPGHSLPIHTECCSKQHISHVSRFCHTYKR